MNPSDRILPVNGGSSSIKFAIFEACDPPQRVLGGAVERGGLLDASPNWIDSLERAGSLKGLAAIGHRVVHGGPDHFDPQLVTPVLLADLKKSIPLDPSHLPAEIALIEDLGARFPGVSQVVCFDTAFHKELPRVAAQFPIPRRYWEAGIRRYGFHGLSYTYLLGELERRTGPQAARGRVIFAHLGGGSSLAAVRDGKCFDTTMGFTPTGGLMMGTRSGDLDPGLLVWLMRSGGMTPDRLGDLVNERSGLLGVSGTSSDMREILARRAEDPKSNEAFHLYCYSVRKGLGAMAATIGGVDTIVFSGGIGENCPEVRARILSGLGFDIRFDNPANLANAPLISSSASPVTVRVIRTDEEAVIARNAFDLLAGRPTPKQTISFFDPPVVPATADLLKKMDAYWRAANFLSIGQIYLLDNPLLKEPLKREHIKPRLLGHWGTTPGLNLVYVHLNRIVRQYDLDVLYIAGPGHGGPGIVANTYLEGTYSGVYPHITRDEAGLKKLFRQFSFPGGIGSHCTAETPGSIHEGGELGYSLAHAYGAAFDNPDLLVACVVGDGEAETGPLATAWHSNKFLNPARDGAVLPILHLNGYKIANPTVLARMPREELQSLFEGYGYDALFVEGDDPAVVHRELAGALDTSVTIIQSIQRRARAVGFQGRPTWPMIVLRTPKGWTCPREIDGKLTEGSWRSHQVPLADMTSDAHVRILESWMKSYRPEELFDERGGFVPELAALAPEGKRRMGASPHANGGAILRDLELPDYRTYAVAVPSPGGVSAEATRMQGAYLRDVMKANSQSRNFRVFSPDELASNRWQDLLDATGRCFVGTIDADDGTRESPDGRVMEVLSEHLCQGWLEGYLLTGRHGYFSCYEAFVHIVDSMVNQYAKWLKVCREVPWRRPVASLNYLLSSHVWQQDHNGFSHQDPGFLDHVVNKKAEVVRIYLPPDANCLLSVTDHCLRSRSYVNVVVAGKAPAPQWLTMEQADEHCAAGLGIWEWAGSGGGEPDIVLGCCGDVPTLEVLAAADLLREHLPDLGVRVVNVVDLMKLQPVSEHPHGLSDAAFDALFTADKPIIFNFHGYPWLIHRLTYRRANHRNLHVRGYKEEGTTTTPFDMCVLNEIDRFGLVKDVVKRVPGLVARAGHVAAAMDAKRAAHKAYTREHGTDMPEIVGWKRGGRAAAGFPAPDTACENA